MHPITFEISGVDFEFDANLKLPLQVVLANFRVGAEVVPARVGFIWREDGLWQLTKLSWTTDRAVDPKSLDPAAAQKIAALCANVLRPMSIKSGDQGEEGIPVLVNFGRVAPVDAARVWSSHRPGVLNIASPSWESLWERIERRIQFDEAFFVQGFGKDEVKIAATRLAAVFPTDWVRARYRRAGFDYPNADIGPQHDDYFPAYHIARAASGALCIDPGWTYLTELGLALEKLKNIDGVDRLRRALTSSSGSQHHVCMAAEFAARGILQGVEPETGLGSTRNDLLLKLNDNNYQVELKEFSSASPIKRLKKELAAKAGNLPETPTSPVVFHVVLLEQGGLDPKREADFCAAINESIGEVSKRISAIVVGRRFLDSAGGPIKRDTLQIFLVPDAATPTTEDCLKKLFPANYENLEYPLFGLNAPMHFGQATPGDQP